jgi:hypothetical protein
MTTTAYGQTTYMYSDRNGDYTQRTFKPQGGIEITPSYRSDCDKESALRSQRAMKLMAATSNKRK